MRPTPTIRRCWFHLAAPLLAVLLVAAFLLADETPPSQARTVRVAAISFVPKKFDLAGNAERLERAFRQAHAGGAKIAVAPEGVLEGYVVNELIAGEVPIARMNDVALPIDSPVIARFQKLARELKMCLVFGFAERIQDDVFNCAVFIDHDGRICGKYHKMQLAEGYHPSWWFNRLGAKSRAFDTPYGKCGLLICNDRWNTQLARIPALDGAQLLIIPAFGSRGKSQDEAVLSRARENELPVIEANVGVTLIADGNSIVAVDRQEEGITFAEVTIGAAAATDVAERDRVERAFLAWREQEMRRRYERTMQRIERKKAEESDSRAPPLLGAYYYPWYRGRQVGIAAIDERTRWIHRALRGRLVPRQLPKLGVYDSRNPDVIAAHIAQSQRGSIDFWAVSWWGPGTWADGTFRDHVLAHPHAGKLKYAVLYESTRMGSFDDPDYSHLLKDFDYLAETYFLRPQYLKLDGKPVVFIYLSRVYFRNRAADVLAQLREAHPNLFLIGDDVFGPHYRQEYARPWDAVTAYDVYGQSLQTAGANAAALQQLHDNYATARRLAHLVDTGFVPAISPGFNDRAVRRGHPGRVRYYGDVEDSQEGDLFRDMISQVALPLRDPRAHEMIMVTSFNEWYEDTQIEATTGTAEPTHQDNSATGEFYTQGDRYADYGYLYLDLLREGIRGTKP